jgi:L-asparaginase
VLKEAIERSIPVLVVSQCVRGTVDLTRYGGAASAAAQGAISAGDMTMEAALVKMMIGIGRHGTGPALRKYLETDQVGERS